MDPPGKMQQEKADAPAHQGHDQSHDGPRRPFPPGRFGEPWAELFFKKSDELAHEHHGMDAAQGVPQQAI